MGLLVERSGGLVLSMALARQAGKVAEVQRTVDDVGREVSILPFMKSPLVKIRLTVVRGQGVRENVGGAAAVDVSAVSASGTAAGGTTVVGDGAETGCDRRAGAGRGTGKEMSVSCAQASYHGGPQTS